MSQPTIIPALPPPPGVRSNFVNPYSLRPFNDICQAFCLSLTTIAVFVRIYTNSHNSRGLAADDCMNPLAISSIAQLIRFLDTACAAWARAVHLDGNPHTLLTCLSCVRLGFLHTQGQFSPRSAMAPEHTHGTFLSPI